MVDTLQGERGRRMKNGNGSLNEKKKRLASRHSSRNGKDNEKENGNGPQPIRNRKLSAFFQVGHEIDRREYIVKECHVKREGSYFFRRICESSPENPIRVAHHHLGQALDLLMVWLRHGNLPRLGEEGETRSIREKASLPNDTLWPIAVIRSCVLSEDWICPLVFNDAIDHFALMHTSQHIYEPHLRLLYRETKTKSSLRRLVADIIARQSANLNHMQYFDFARENAEFMKDMWEKMPLAGNSLFARDGTMLHDPLKDYHMPVPV